MKREGLIPATLLSLFTMVTVAAGVVSAGPCASHGIDQQKYIQDIKACVQEVRLRDAQFAAYLNPDTCSIKQYGSNNENVFWQAHTEFTACMRQAGWQMND